MCTRRGHRRTWPSPHLFQRPSYRLDFECPRVLLHQGSSPEVFFRSLSHLRKTGRLRIERPWFWEHKVQNHSERPREFRLREAWWPFQSSSFTITQCRNLRSGDDQHSLGNSFAFNGDKRSVKKCPRWFGSVRREVVMRQTKRATRENLPWHVLVINI